LQIYRVYTVYFWIIRGETIFVGKNYFDSKNCVKNPGHQLIFLDFIHHNFEKTKRKPDQARTQIFLRTTLFLVVSLKDCWDALFS